MADTYSQEDLEQYVTRMVEDAERDWEAKPKDNGQILCRDCKYHVAHYGWNRKITMKCVRWDKFPAQEFDYCSRAERKK